MDTTRKENDPKLVCTCNDLYVADIEDSIAYGEDEYREIFAVHGLQPRCGECAEHVNQLVEKNR